MSSGFSALHRGQGPAGFDQRVRFKPSATRFSALHRGQGPAGGPHPSAQTIKLASFSALHRGQGPAGTGLRVTGSWSSTSFSALHRGQGPAGWVVNNHIFATNNHMFQCPPSRAGSCGKFKPSATRRVLRDGVFQCPPSRAGSCGSGPTSLGVQIFGGVSVPSIAGRVLRVASFCSAVLCGAAVIG